MTFKGFTLFPFSLHQNYLKLLPHHLMFIMQWINGDINCSQSSLEIYSVAWLNISQALRLQKPVLRLPKFCLYRIKPLDGTDCLIVIFPLAYHLLTNLPPPKKKPWFWDEEDYVATLSTNSKSWHLFLKWIKAFFILFVFYLLKTITSFNSFDSPEAFSSPLELQ